MSWVCHVVEAKLCQNFLRNNQSISIYVSIYQVQTDISVDTKHQTLQGVAFPLHGDAMNALEQFKDKKLNYVQLVSEVWVYLF